MGLSVRGGMVAGYRTTGYQGPGDIIAGASDWWGLRAYTQASIGSNAIRLRESQNNTENDFTTTAGGGLPLTAIDNFRTTNGSFPAATLFATKLYDQVGSLDLAETTAANQPSFILNGIGSLPVLRSASLQRLSNPSLPKLFAPYALIAVAKRTAGSGFSTILATNGGNNGIWFGNTDNFISLYTQNSSMNAPSSEGFVRSVIGVCTSTTAAIYVDGVRTDGGGGGDSTAGIVSIMNDNFNEALTGDWMEAGTWAPAISITDPQATAMTANHRGFWGF